MFLISLSLSDIKFSGINAFSRSEPFSQMEGVCSSFCHISEQSPRVAYAILETYGWVVVYRNDSKTNLCTLHSIFSELIYFCKTRVSPRYDSIARLYSL